jgi:hypothetical protein
VTIDVDPFRVALVVVSALETIGVTSTIGGSIASSFAGEPRSTIDIDIVAALEERHIPALVDALSAEFYVDGDALRRAIRAKTSANLIHQATMLKVDLFIAGGTPLDAQQLARRLRVNLVDGRTLFVHPPEDILLQKLRWFQQGGGMSDRQWRDVKAIVRVQASRLDRLYLRRNAPLLGVVDLLERALEDDSADSPWP